MWSFCCDHGLRTIQHHPILMYNVAETVNNEVRVGLSSPMTLFPSDKISNNKLKLWLRFSIFSTRQVTGHYEKDKHNREYRPDRSAMQRHCGLRLFFKKISGDLLSFLSSSAVRNEQIKRLSPLISSCTWLIRRVSIMYCTFEFNRPTGL